MWHGRFKKDMADEVLDFTQSLDIDWRMAECDIKGSLAHVKMLGKAGLLKADEAEKIALGLEKVLEEVKTGKFIPSKNLEDVHMNIEARLTEIEPLGAKLHTARSRNDQVATTTRLYLRERLKILRGELKNLLKVLVSNSEKHLNIINANS